MAEAFELYYIPQQTRRDKLRTLAGDLQACTDLDLYDPSPFLSCATLLPTQHTKQTQTTSLMAAASSNTNNSSINELSDLQPVRDEDNRHCSFIYAHQDLRLIHGGDAVVYTPETLALSLSSHNTHTGEPHLGLRFPAECGGGEFGRSTVVTLGPYTGYASVLKGSKFLKPAQEVLDGICEVGFGIYAEKFGVDCGLMMDDPPLMESLRTSVYDSSYGGGDKSKKSRLISLLDEVYKRYKQYYQQIQAVIASFEAVTGLSRAAPFVNLDLKAMSKHFRCLNNAITDQLHFSNKTQECHISYAKEELLYGQHVGYVDHQPIWRPQRGLPKRAVTVLRAWLFDHFLHPYPTDTDKQLLAKQTGLSRNQVSNWFINARVRLWRPMVEEVHTLETRQVHTVSSHIHHHQVQDPPSKRAKNDNKRNNHDFVEQNKEQMNFYNNFSIENRGVSLTLGLHQNNNNNKAMMLAEAIPLNGAGSESFVMGGFLHDFGG